MEKALYAFGFRGPASESDGFLKGIGVEVDSVEYTYSDGIAGLAKLPEWMESLLESNGHVKVVSGDFEFEAEMP